MFSPDFIFKLLTNTQDIIAGDPEARVLQHQKKRPGVDFFTKANSAGLTDLLIRNASIYSNITSSLLMLTSPGCLLYVEVVTHTILVDSSS